MIFRILSFNSLRCNGDGPSDEIIGAYGNSSSKGRVYLYYDISPNPF
ncbi:MAG: hypothetical protein IPI04_14785 [Ignavibacteria bacterium]|nr:hypothetical protein [Ignavibacteria bacterium]